MLPNFLAIFHQYALIYLIKSSRTKETLTGRPPKVASCFYIEDWYANFQGHYNCVDDRLPILNLKKSLVDTLYNNNNNLLYYSAKTMVKHFLCSKHFTSYKTRRQIITTN
jgi:hypothetical protein